MSFYGHLLINISIFLLITTFSTNKIYVQNIYILAISAFIFIPSSENIFSCSVTIFSSNIDSLCKSYVLFIIVNHSCTKYSKLASNNSSESVLKYISPFPIKNCLYNSNCLICVNLFLLCFFLGHGLQKFI